jgi:glycosyltransferase involved in cell wall biosynthesis
MPDNEKQPIKVIMLMTNLDDLGVQRVVINLFNHFDRLKIKPTLVLWKNEGRVSSFLRKSDAVIETDHDLLRPRLFFRLIRYFRIIKETRPDLVISFVPVTNISYALIKFFLPKKIGFITCEHAFISRAFSTGEYTGAFKVLYRMLFNTTYNVLSDRLVMTAYAGEKDAVNNWGIDERKIKIIHNPQDILNLQQRSKEPLNDPWFTSTNKPILIGAGRLTKQKGFDSLIKAFAIVNKTKSCKLAILGRGELDQTLEKLTLSLGVNEDVRFLGFQENHLKYIKHASIFVLSSIWEAMPMVVAETMAIGVPIVSFDCPSGPHEMLDGGECGFLVEDQNIEALATMLLEVLDDPQQASEKAAKALIKVKEFDVVNIVEKYQELIDDVVVKISSEQP